MINDLEPLELNGDIPMHFIGHSCESLLCQEYWYEGAIVEASNVAFLKFNGEWQRLYFDWGIVFWRNETKAPESFDAEELSAQFPVSDVGLKYGLLGKRLSAINLRSVKGGSEVALSFECGTSIVFRNTNDVTTFFVFAG
jgi:hypothetical protein